jgi:hypothetical protein
MDGRVVTRIQNKIEVISKKYLNEWTQNLVEEE